VAGGNRQNREQKILPCSGHADACVQVLLLSQKFLCRSKSDAEDVKVVNMAQTSEKRSNASFMTFRLARKSDTVRPN
jgi:hypothetical protein